MPDAKEILVRRRFYAIESQQKEKQKNTELRHVSVHNAYHEAAYRQHEQLLYTILKH